MQSRRRCVDSAQELGRRNEEKIVQNSNNITSDIKSFSIIITEKQTYQLFIKTVFINNCHVRAYSTQNGES